MPKISHDKLVEGKEYFFRRAFPPTFDIFKNNKKLVLGKGIYLGQQIHPNYVTFRNMVFGTREQVWEPESITGQNDLCCANFEFFKPIDQIFFRERLYFHAILSSIKGVHPSMVEEIVETFFPSHCM
jgi:hypothetical protein